MQTTLSQLVSRVDYGSPIHRRHQYRMPPGNRMISQPSKFEALLRQEHRTTKQPGMMPPTIAPKTEHMEQPGMMPPTIAPKPGDDEGQGGVSTPPSAHARAAFRSGYMKGFRFLRKLHPEMGQGQMGWVTTRIARALTDNPYMSKKDLKSMVRSLVSIVPEHETGVEIA